MLRLILIMGLVAGGTTALAADEDVPLAELDKWYVAEGTKLQKAELKKLEQQIADLQTLLAKLKAVGVSETARREVQGDIANLEELVIDLKGNPYIPPRLDPRKFAVGQVGMPFGDFEDGKAVIRTLKVIDEKGMLVQFEKTDVVVWMGVDTANIEERDRAAVTWKCAIVGKRMLNGQSYLYLTVYVPPERRNKPDGK